MNVLEVKNLNKKYGDTEVIKDVSFSVKEGETLVILGPSGSGKSTMLRCINNLEQISNGNVIINGEKMIKEYKNGKPVYSDKEVLNKINIYTGMVFQDFNLFPHLTVKDNITMALKYVLKMDKTEADKKAYALLDKMGLASKSEEYPCNLSGGQKQRVSIARCLAIDPKIICMDEPTSSLDPELVGEVLKAIKELANEKRTMVIVTHEIKFAEEVADRVIFMDGGKIIEEGSPRAVIRNPKEKRTREFLKRYRSIENMEELDIAKESPKEVLRFFKEISDIPRKSGNEEEIRNYLVNFAKQRNLEYYTDKYFNVIIRKEASKGLEDKEGISFQGHTDMICEKEEWSTHDFSKDPITLLKDGDFIKANGTTLGADNGIGVAFMLALLDCKELKTPKMECIFTVQEETTMIGAKEIDVNEIKSKKIISLDNGKEGRMVISSANCMEWYGKINKDYVDINGLKSYELIYSNFKGGHSGGNIADVKRGNPIKLGIEILAKLEGVYISKIQGGSRVNVIPRDFEVQFSCKKDCKNIINEEINKQKEFYGEGVKIELKEIKPVKKSFTKDTSTQIIDFINSYSNGALKFDENGNVILSANFAAINEIEDYVRLEYSIRSNNMKLRDEYLENLEKQVNKDKVEVIWYQELKGFEPDYESELVKRAEKVYKQLFNKDIEKNIVQGVVEGGFFKSRMEDVQYICIGANTFDVHSPKERVSIESLKRTWEYLKALVSVD